MNIFITGGSGFIGHNVARMLQTSHSVTTYDSETTYGCLKSDEVASLHKERQALMDRCTLIRGDICNRGDLYTAMAVARPEVVIHMAAFPRAKVVNADPPAGANVMTVALLTLLELSKAFKVRRFVYISSSMVYGDFDSGVKEDAVCNPKGTYAILKYAGELLVKDFCTANNIEYVIVRPSAVYGPRDVEDRVLSKFLMNALHGDDIVVKGANEVLDFSYVEDVAAGIVLTATHENAPDNIFNMTRGVGVSLLDAAKLVVEITGSKSKIVMADKDASFPSRGTLSTVHARSLLNYSPAISLMGGSKQYYNWITQK
jgi:nucleoside-diphosphate-sugar epimerase